MSRRWARLASSMGAALTSSRSCLIMEPMRMTLAGSSTVSRWSAPSAGWSGPAAAGSLTTMSEGAGWGVSSAGMPASLSGSGLGGQQRYPHLGRGERAVPTDHAGLARLGAVEEGDGGEGHQGHVPQAVLDPGRGPAAQPPRGHDLLPGVDPGHIAVAVPRRAGQTRSPARPGVQPAEPALPRLRRHVLHEIAVEQKAPRAHVHLAV